MKKLFEKHTLAKMLGILAIIAVVLTWIFPYGVFQGTQFYEYGSSKIGLSDIPSVVYNSIYFAIDKLVYLFVLAGFYGLLSRTKGYNKLVLNIAKKIKGKEVLATIVTSVIITIITSITTNTFAVLLVIPFVYSILTNGKVNKLGVFASTFGAMLVGVLGATYGTDALIAFNTYFSQTLTGKSALQLTLVYRFIILGIALVLYNLFVYFAVKNKQTKKNSKSDALVNEEFIVEEVKDKKVKVFPVAIILGLVLLFFILGFIDWNGTFKIEVFDKFHEWLTKIKIGKDFTIVSYLLGTSAVAFGYFDLFTLSTVLVVMSIILAILYKINFSELLDAFADGIKKIIAPVGVIVAIYSVFMVVYISPIMPTIIKSIMPKDQVVDINIDYKGSVIPFFNVDTDDDMKADYNLVNQDTNKDGKCDINCDTNKDGYPDKNLDFNADKKSDEKDEEIAAQFNGTSAANIDADQDGIADVNIDTDFSLVRTMLAAIVTNVYQVDLGYTGYSIGGYLVEGFGAIALGLVFLVFFVTYALLQFVAPTSILLMFGLSYTKTSMKDWYKFIWRFALGMLIVSLIIFIFMILI